MSKQSEKYSLQEIENKIFTIRGIHVMIDSDIAEMYDVETKVLNQAVKRNIARFPDSFRFQLTEEETINLRSQIVTLEREDHSLRSQSVTLESQRGKHRKYLPYVFTEQGVSMLSAVLRSDTAIQVSIRIMNAFVEMRKFITANSNVFQRLDIIEKNHIEFKSETDQKFDKIFLFFQNPFGFVNSLSNIATFALSLFVGSKIKPYVVFCFPPFWYPAFFS